MILTASRDKTIIMWTLTRDEVGLLCIAERMEVLQRITGQREPLEQEQKVSREPGQERRLGGSYTTKSGGELLPKFWEQHECWTKTSTFGS